MIDAKEKGSFNDSSYIGLSWAKLKIAVFVVVLLELYRESGEGFYTPNVFHGVYHMSINFQDIGV